MFCMCRISKADLIRVSQIAYFLTKRILAMV